jgi:flagellum-specific peptidoglycan hydrolase FlgJ
VSDPTKLADAAFAAVVAENATGIPADLTMAQWAIESGWGDHSPQNNCFGIKSYSGEYGRQLLKTVEWLTDAEKNEFLARGDGRKIENDPVGTAVTASGRKRYILWDWFATFPTLAACFAKRAQLFTAGRYKPFADAYMADKDIAKLVRGISVIYATAPDYGELLMKVIQQHNVHSALLAARTPSAGGPVAT